MQERNNYRIIFFSCIYCVKKRSICIQKALKLIQKYLRKIFKFLLCDFHSCHLILKYYHLIPHSNNKSLNTLIIRHIYFHACTWLMSEVHNYLLYAYGYLIYMMITNYN